MQMIAQKLDLSVATVSRALRRIPGINPGTRARVVQAAAELSYRLPKSHRPQSLEKRDGLQHVGVLIETPRTDLPAPYLTGLSEASMALNASLVVHHVKPGDCEKILDPRFQPRAMSAGLLCGLILIFRWPVDVVRQLSEKYPTVSIAHRYPGVDLDVVGIDNQIGIELLLRHLHGLGHQKFGFFGRCSALHWAAARFGSYVAALTDLDLEYRAEQVIDVDLETLTDPSLPWSRFTAPAEELTRRGVTAWICATEPAGRALYESMNSHGFDVPRDVSITGFHRPDLLVAAETPLTSVTASYEAIGAAALKRLLYRTQNPIESTRTVLFPCELFPGQTVAPPRPV